jgi:hypothetical protein
VEGAGHTTGRSQHSLLMAEVNDRIFEINALHSEDGEFLCECSDESCIETITLTLREYAALKGQPERPVLKLPRHPG